MQWVLVAVAKSKKQEARTVTWDMEGHLVMIDGCCIARDCGFSSPSRIRCYELSMQR